MSTPLDAAKTGETPIATVKEEFERLKALINAGKEQERIHIVYTDRDARKRQENPQKSTRIVFNTYSADAYAEFYKQKERYFKIAVDPHLAVDLMIRALAAFSDATVRDWVEQGHSPEVNALPDWAKE